MRRPVFGLVVILILAGVGLSLGFYKTSTALVWLGGFVSGSASALAVVQKLSRSRPQPSTRARNGTPDSAERLMTILLDMGDALQETSPDALQRRGGWNRALFDDVLAHVEDRAPRFQRQLVAYLAYPTLHDPACVQALLAVDRLSAAYTYWTRLFPPRQSDESMFVLSLLHDLSEKVEHAITLLNTHD
jgi:hypothetical protein